MMLNKYGKRSELTPPKQKYELGRIVVLIVVGLLLVSGCVEKSVTLPPNSTKVIEEVKTEEVPPPQENHSLEPIPEPTKEAPPANPPKEVNAPPLEDEDKIITFNGKKTKRVRNTSISGKFHENQVWEGEILVTGDTHIDGDLDILPGTIVRFAVGDDVGWGNEVAPDGYNDFDPTRLKSYETTHADLVVNGKLRAQGMPGKLIVFTSAAPNPNYGDWVGVHIGVDHSIVEYCLVEWSRHGLSLGSDTPNTIIRNNVINYTLWGSISSGDSSAQIYGNEIWESGHEGIDVQGGNPFLENNTIFNAHTGIVILEGSALVRNNRMIDVGNGVHIAPDATPLLENNFIELAPSNSKLKWGYGNFSYVMFGEAIVKK